MQQLTSAGEQAVQRLSERYGVSVEAVKTMLLAVSAGGGSMAQFYCSELGGGGQWMRGGMTMVGDMFNHGLKATVDNLCSELSTLLANEQVFLPTPQGEGQGGMMSSNNWWPAELGQPSSSGGQNDSRYAYFPGTQRLAISRGGQVTVYDTLNHQIGGVQQQQGGAYGTLSFSSQFGTFTVDSLPLIGPAPDQRAAAPAPEPPMHVQQPAYEPPAQSSNAQPSYGTGANGPQSHGDILSALERLGDLKQKGVLSDAEFSAKKAELLARL